MKLKTISSITCFAATMTVAYAQQPVVHFDMTSAADGTITELVSKQKYAVNSQLPVCDVEGLTDKALLFDGYSNYVKAQLTDGVMSTSQLTLNVVLAAETYPMMNTGEAEITPTYGTICGNLDAEGKSGFALQVSSQGHLRFTFVSEYAKGYTFTINGSEKLTLGHWNQVTAVLDKNNNAATLYLNGNSIGTCRMSRSDMLASTEPFYIGKSPNELKMGSFHINTFCGMIDDIAVYNEALTPDQLPQVQLSTRPDFNYPASRYAASLWRPQFHGMPSAGWTNECHGMAYSDGRYHLYFQKNANGPYMARLHWGHISSENLYKWREEPIAIAPGEAYDLKGCWSGCVYDNNGTPNILYTAVDNGRATIAHATPLDDSLVDWNKTGILINGRPAGLNDDFRDPYYFADNGNQYIIVGSNKNGLGCCTLHKYANGSWTNDGKLFFQASNATQQGVFWEMSNVTKMENGKWLFTTTPLGAGSGVRVLYWTGSINADGTFNPDNAQAKTLEMNGISKDGYGLLSPTILQKDGKTLMLGIVPDKLPTEQNFLMGWAHNYSLPREISLDDNGELIQRPYSGLQAMRTETCVSKDMLLTGTESLDPVNGRQIELLGEFTVGSGSVGFNMLKNDHGCATLSYNADNGMITFDISTLERQNNDGGVYDGVYSAPIPVKPAVGETLKLHVYLDGSIADIFVNDRWAFSVRLFPRNAEQTAAEVFATSPTQVKVQAWTLDADRDANTGISTIQQCEADNAMYDVAGRRLTKPQPRTLVISKGKKHYAH